MALTSFLMCCAVGVATIWHWKNWELYSGFNFNEIIDSFNKRKFFAMNLLLLRDVIDSYDMMKTNNYFIRRRMSFMIIFLFGGIASMLTGLVV